MDIATEVPEEVAVLAAAGRLKDALAALGLAQQRASTARREADDAGDQVTSAHKEVIAAEANLRRLLAGDA